MKKVMWTNSAYERVLKTKEKKDRFYSSYNNNTELLDIIADALNEKLRVYQDVVASPEAYKDSSWAYKQADSIGYKRAIKEIVQLLTIRDTQLNDRPN